jgi:hypothetical protein
MYASENTHFPQNYSGIFPQKGSSSFLTTAGILLALLVKVTYSSCESARLKIQDCQSFLQI